MIYHVLLYKHVISRGRLGKKKGKKGDLGGFLWELDKGKIRFFSSSSNFLSGIDTD